MKYIVSCEIQPVLRVSCFFAVVDEVRSLGENLKARLGRKEDENGVSCEIEPVYWNLVYLAVVRRLEADEEKIIGES